jgi:hypothetical protein
MSIKRTLPRSSNSRFDALNVAKQKKDSTAAAKIAITPATSSRLDAVHASFGQGRNTLSVKVAESVLATTQKEALQYGQKLKNSHYVQVFNMHIEQDIFPAAYRAYFKIDTNSAAVPLQNTEAEITALAQAIIDGEPNMIAAGGVAIPFPKMATIQAGLTALVAKQKDQSTKKDATDAAQEALLKMNTEADAVIKKVWDETETFWNEEPTESKRRKSREWGVVYVSDDTKATITGIVKDKATGIAIAAATVTIVSSDEGTTTDATGAFALKTGTEDAQVLNIDKAGYAPKDIDITVVLGEDIDLGVVELEVE